MTSEERSALRIVLKALHLAATKRPRDDEAPEQRGRAYGPPSWHEGVELWSRALAITAASDDDPPFDAAWERLVEQSRVYLATE